MSQPPGGVKETGTLHVLSFRAIAPIWAVDLPTEPYYTTKR